MNQPDPHELFVLPDLPGITKVSYQADSKITNAGLFIIRKEDHTMGNLLKMQLLEDPDVIFAGYRVPHPLEHNANIRIQTNLNSNPIIAMKKAVGELRNEVQTLEEKFRDDIKRFKDPNQML